MAGASVGLGPAWPCARTAHRQIHRHPRRENYQPSQRIAHLFRRIAEYGQGNAGVPKKAGTQDVEEAARIVSGLGKYPVELTERGLLILGHLSAA